MQHTLVYFMNVLGLNCSVQNLWFYWYVGREHSRLEGEYVK